MLKFVLNNLEIMESKLFSVIFFPLFFSFHFSFGMNPAVHVLSMQELLAGSKSKQAVPFTRGIKSLHLISLLQNSVPFPFAGVGRWCMGWGMGGVDRWTDPTKPNPPLV